MDSRDCCSSKLKLKGGASKQIDHHLELAAPRPRAFGFFA